MNLSVSIRVYLWFHCSMTWETANLGSRDNRLHIDGVDAVELAREYGTPLFVFSEE